MDEQRTNGQLMTKIAYEQKEAYENNTGEQHGQY